ncbi:hypothetical protein OAM91_02920 [Gammaproteobacteria bacterium]|jgi:hypothetical protein|nr:hypothetical protein [Gammaproteobacteria bacterium]
MRINILNFIQEHAIFHSDMLYDESRKSFDMSSYENNHPGIYFILDGDDLLKIGKADGNTGLKGRISTYRTRLVRSYETGDQTTILWHTVMTGTLKSKKLKMYVLPVDPIKVSFKGMEVNAMMARSLEKKLSELANIQGHSMMLSGQN